MAEVVVEIVLKQLADFIANEAMFLGGVRKKVKRVQRELTRIKSCLDDTDFKRKGDERVQNWLNELCDVTYRIEDTIDHIALRTQSTPYFSKLKIFALRTQSTPSFSQRALLQAEEKNSQFMEYVDPNTRSLLLFEPTNCEMSLRCSNFRLLKVLKIMCRFPNRYKLKSLDELIHLKYLGLMKCNNIDLSSCSFKHMRSFETLDVRETMGKPPCDDFLTIGTLRHVLDDQYGTFFNRPISIATLSNLQTLKWVTLQKTRDVKFPNLPKLCIRYESDEWVSLTNLLQKLPFLVSLGISQFTLPVKIVYYLKALPNYRNLHGIWPNNVNVEASMLPPHLLKLSLEDSHFNQNPMPGLGKLKNLKKLRLQGYVFAGIGGNSIICPEGFPILQYLKVNDEEITDFTVAHGVMPNLTDLQVNSKIKVHLPPELEHVTVVQLW